MAGPCFLEFNALEEYVRNPEPKITLSNHVSGHDSCLDCKFRTKIAGLHDTFQNGMH